MSDPADLAARWTRYWELPDLPEHADEAEELLTGLVELRAEYAAMAPGPDRDLVALYVGLALTQSDEVDDQRAAIGLLAGPVRRLPPEEPWLAGAAMRLAQAIVLAGLPADAPRVTEAAVRAAELVDPSERWQFWLLLAKLCQLHWDTGPFAELRAASITFATAGLAVPAPPEMPLELHFLRLLAVLAGPDGAQRLSTEPALVDQAYAAWRSVSGSDSRDRLSLALALAASLLWESGRFPIPPPVLRVMYETGIRAPGLPDEVRNRVRAQLAGSKAVLAALGNLPPGESAYADVKEIATAVGGLDGDTDELGRELLALVRKALPALGADRALDIGDRAAQESALVALLDLFEGAGDVGGPTGRLARMARLAKEVDRTGDPRLRAELTASASRLARDFPDDELMRSVAWLLPLMTYAAQPGAAARPVPEELLRPPASAGLPVAVVRLGRLVTTLARANEAGADALRLRGLADELEPMLAEAGLGTRLSAWTLETITMIRLRVARLTRAPSDVRAAVDRGEQTVRMVGGPDRPRWEQVARYLAEALRLRDGGAGADRRRARDLDLASLRGHAWQTMLQSGTRHAVAAATRAAATAARVAANCFDDRAYDDGVRALDAGRGLVLYAATASRSVPELLRGAGRPDLADEWSAADGAGPRTGYVPDDLRHRALLVLTGLRSATAATRVTTTGTGSTRLLDPPELDQIRAALTTIGLDALVYLVPGAPGRAGAIVVVSATRPTAVLPAPTLTPRTAPAVVDYLRATRDRQAATERRIEVEARWRDALDRLGEWAWPAAIEPLLDHLRGWRLGREPRIGLVPMGVLGAVPWHAASRTRRGRTRYAVQDLQLSYVPSARLLCEVAAAPATIGEDALIVGNPDESLRGAAEEARAIRDAFYPRGRYLAGDATADRVRGWLAGRTRSGHRGVLHLGCHGLASPAQPWLSELTLAGGQKLTAGELLDLVPDGSTLVDLVLLSACETNVTGEDYDEAFSLSTSFLVAGARSVIGSCWPVPDDATALLMYMVHHHLRERGLSPAAALRAAQLWMLDPDRAAPASMTPGLRNLADRARFAKPIAWAGFTHVGR